MSAMLELTRIASALSETDRDAFLAAHATTVQLLDDPAAQANYVSALVATVDKPEWAEIKHDPVALLIWGETSDPATRLLLFQAGVMFGYLLGGAG